MHPEPYDVVAVNLDPQADNRIHDDDVAQSFGFTGALVPGVELFALATAPLVRAWGEEFLTAGRLQVRFRRPVYDGEQVQVTTTPRGDGAYDLVLAGPDGEPRTVGVAASRAQGAAARRAQGAAASRAQGSAARRGPQEPPRPYDAAPLPERLLDAPVVGPFGTVAERAEPDALRGYATAVGDPFPLYDEIAHPGLLLRLVNACLMRNVLLGPWIHTASDCRFLGLARAGDEVEARSRVTEVFSRGGHDRVRYDALVTAAGRPVLEVAHEAIWRLGPGSSD